MSQRTSVTLLLILTAAEALIFLLLPRIPQPEAYHLFAERRSLLGIPNFVRFGHCDRFLRAGEGFGDPRQTNLRGWAHRWWSHPQAPGRRRSRLLLSCACCKSVDPCRFCRQLFQSPRMKPKLNQSELLIHFTYFPLRVSYSTRNGFSVFRSCQPSCAIKRLAWARRSDG